MIFVFFLVFGSVILAVHNWDWAQETPGDVTPNLGCVFALKHPDKPWIQFNSHGPEETIDRHLSAANDACDGSWVVAHEYWCEDWDVLGSRLKARFRDEYILLNRFRISTDQFIAALEDERGRLPKKIIFGDLLGSKKAISGFW